MVLKKHRNLCDINPFFYFISVKKEIIIRHLKNIISKEKFANDIKKEKLPNIVYEYSCNMIKRGKGVDIKLQKNKAVNIEIASSKINRIIVHPGETFSFWKTVGAITKKRGYKAGRVISKKGLSPGIGGGLCNLGNTVNLLILHSPLEITELHKHSDALAPDEGKRVPFSSGTSISYNYVDYRFKNNTNQDVQLNLWCKNGKLFGELRSEKEFPYTYKLLEENHHFEKDGDKYYRVSQIYKIITEKATGKDIAKELIWDNRSLVMYDYNLIPKDMIIDKDNIFKKNSSIII